MKINANSLNGKNAECNWKLDTPVNIMEDAHVDTDSSKLKWEYKMHTQPKFRINKIFSINNYTKNSNVLKYIDQIFLKFNVTAVAEALGKVCR